LPLDESCCGVVFWCIEICCCQPVVMTWWHSHSQCFIGHFPCTVVAALKSLQLTVNHHHMVTPTVPNNQCVISQFLHTVVATLLLHLYLPEHLLSTLIKTHSYLAWHNLFNVSIAQTTLICHFCGRSSWWKHNSTCFCFCVSSSHILHKNTDLQSELSCYFDCLCDDRSHVWSLVAQSVAIMSWFGLPKDLPVLLGQTLFSCQLFDSLVKKCKRIIVIKLWNLFWI